MAARLLDGHNDASELVLGLPERVFKEIHYSYAAAVEQDLAKLFGTYDLERRIPELARSAPSYIQASTLGRTPFTERLGRLMNEPLVRRLAGVSQLGLLNALYPTATHTRLEHSLGTYTNTAQYILYLYNDPLNPFFRQVMDADDLVSTLVAAFLHDLGQYPLAHDLEDAHKIIFRHGALTNVLLTGDRVDVKALSEGLERRLLEDWEVKMARVVAILGADTKNQDLPIKDRLLHTLVDGPIDADKLDYLVRDSHECGVPYGLVIDFPRMLRTLTVVYYREKERFHIGLGIHEKGRVAAECVAFARYAMFSQVYWHHTARAAKAMLHRAVWEWLETDKRSNDLKKSDFHSFLMALGRPKDDQKTLFDEQVSRKGDVLPSSYGDRGWSQFHPGDVNVLQWIRDRTTQDGAILIEDILRRRFFKRLAVVSESRNEKLWSDLKQVRRLQSTETMLSLSRTLQHVLYERVKTAKESGTRLTSTSADQDAVDVGIGVLKSRASILVDVPGARMAEDEILRYLPETHHREQRDLFAQAPTMEDSKVWGLVGGHVFAIAGKVRVFAHPAVAILGGNLLGPESVEAHLTEAARITLEKM
jgi:HD superfamily phosphohydrolase